MVAMHRALAPTTLNSENCKASRKMAGCISAFALTAPVPGTLLGKPKWENMRRSRSRMFSASVDVTLGGAGAVRFVLRGATSNAEEDTGATDSLGGLDTAGLLGAVPLLVPLGVALAAGAEGPAAAAFSAMRLS